eukprot:COSAG06_NODE_3828_length_4861_cov_4.239605_2_plen_134_part_00
MVVPIRPIDGDVDLALARVGHDAVRVVPGRAVEGHGEGGGPGVVQGHLLLFAVPVFSCPAAGVLPVKQALGLKISVSMLKGRACGHEMQTGQPLPDPVQAPANVVVVRVQADVGEATAAAAKFQSCLGTPNIQ